MSKRLRALVGPVVLVALCSMIVAGCGSDDSDSSSSGSSGAGTSGTDAAKNDFSGTLTYTDYGGDFQKAVTKAWIDPWNAMNPDVKIQQVTTYDPAKLAAMAESGNVTWDLVDTSASDGFDTAKVLTKIDCTVVHCDKFPERAKFDGYRAPVTEFASVNVYNKEKVGDTPPAQGWTDFYDTKKYPGKRAVYQYPTNGQLEGALLADGVKPEDLYPLDIDRAFRKMSTIKDDLVFWQSGDQCLQLVSSGEVTMADCWSGRASQGIENGAPIAIDWNGCLTQILYFGVPNGSKNTAAAMNVIGSVTDPKNNGRMTSVFPYGAVIEGATVAPDAKYKDDVPSKHPTCVPMDPQWLGDHAEDLYTRYSDWMSG